VTCILLQIIAMQAQKATNEASNKHAACDIQSAT